MSRRVQPLVLSYNSFKRNAFSSIQTDCQHVMHDSFNPYREWLGIGGAEDHPNHYKLLGLSELESDSATISAAAERRIAEVFQLQAAPRLALWQRILSELAEAKSTLCNPAEKIKYDALLRRNWRWAVPSPRKVWPHRRRKRGETFCRRRLLV